jgi:protein-S-isoprenylcysteine O-methyltransferase Ste14
MSSEVLRPHGNVTGHPIPEIVLRTRRSVMEAANELQAQRTRKRRHVGVALLAMGVLVFLIAPAVWAGVTDLTTGEHLLDLPLIMLTLFVVLLTAMFAILLLTWRDRAARNER